MTVSVLADPPTTTTFDAVVCLDGSQRAARALGPAIAIANQCGERVRVLAIDVSEATHALLMAQLARVGLTPAALTTVASADDMLATLQDEADRGATPVLAAFGDHEGDDRLGGLLGELIRTDVPRMLAVGPRVVPVVAANRCLVVSADGVCSVDPLIEAAGIYVTDATEKIVVVHVDPPHETSPSFSNARNAAKFAAQFAVPVEAAAITGFDISKTVAELARAQGASLILARSWHRFSAYQPPAASSSLAIVAEASCPVLIVN